MTTVQLNNRFKLGAKVRHITPYGETKQPKEWEQEPYCVVSLIVDFYDLSESEQKLKYRVQKWGDKSSLIFYAWESQLEPWQETTDSE